MEIKLKKDSMVQKQVVPIKGYSRKSKTGNVQIVDPTTAPRLKNITKPLLKLPFKNATEIGIKSLKNLNDINPQNVHDLKDWDVLDNMDSVPKSFKEGISGVSYFKDKKNIGWYFKDKKKEVWTNNEGQFIREGIKDDKLAEREQTAFKISKELGIDIVAPTTIKQLSDGKEGTFQMDVHDFIDKHIKGNSESVNKIANVDTDEHHAALNGMDLAVFDYIIGNTDRHKGNMFIFNKKGKDNLIGIDHGLSFPDVKGTHITDDFFNTFEYGWDNIFNETGGFSKEIGSNFKKALKNSKLSEKVNEHLNATSLNEGSKNSTMERLNSIINIFKTKGTITGEDLGNLVLKGMNDWNIEQESHNVHSYLVPEYISSLKKQLLKHKITTHKKISPTL